MTDRIEQTSAESRNSYSHLDGALKETYSDRISALPVGRNEASAAPKIISFETEDIYTTTASAGTKENEQSDEPNEGFTSRMNREDDRQPYLDSQRHQDNTPSSPSNEQSPEFNEGFTSRTNREGEPQPYFDPERHQENTSFEPAGAGGGSAKFFDDLSLTSSV